MIKYTTQFDLRFRCGSIHVAVLGLSVLLITLALGAMLAVRAQVRAVDLQNDMAEARLYARSGLEVGRLWVDQDASWRINHSNGTWVSNRAIGSGTFTLGGVNPNGTLDANDLDPLILTATGLRGRARQKIQVTLTAVQTPFSCLETAISASAGITMQGATISAAGNIIASNGSMVATNCTVNANVEAVGTVSGGTYMGTIRAASRARSMPRTTAFDYYIANGTAIARAAILTGTMSRALLSPSSNPYGSQTNLKGIYVIDCQGQNITITNCRIIGTLVLLNPGSGSELQGSINWMPAVPSFPSLLVRGSITIRPSTSALSESATGANYNPTGAPYPYPSGTTNTTTTDSYPSIVGGMIYASGNVVLSSSANLGMVFSGGTVNVTSSVTALGLTYDSGYFQTPPPGFSSIKMVLSEGSYRQVVDP
jgi:hypothetical protein